MNGMSLPWILVVGLPVLALHLVSMALTKAIQSYSRGLLEVRVHRPAVGAAIRRPEPLVDALDHLVRERVAELVRVHVGLRRRVAHEVGQEPLDQTVLAHDPLRPLDSRVREDRLLLLAALDEPLGLEPLEHLARGRAGDAEHLRDA